MSKWEWKKLGEVCEFKDSQRKPITASKRISGPYPYYGATGVLDYVDGFLFDEDLILLGEDGAKWGSGDKSAFVISGKTWVNNHAHVLKPDSSIDYQWLIYFLNFSDLMKRSPWRGKRFCSSTMSIRPVRPSALASKC